jgi:2-C-methyl-D-erythritol 4-phosphate cytidylyltransferase
VVPAAGSGSRLGQAVPKALIEIAGKPLFVHAALPFLEHDGFVQAVVACPPNDMDEFARFGRLLPGNERIRYVRGGATRQDSVASALKAIRAEVDVVLIHDAARPLINKTLIGRVLEGMRGDLAAVVPGITLTDTIKRAGGDPRVVEETIRRDDLFAIQTPQAIRFQVAVRAHELAKQDGFQATDDVGLVEHYQLGKVGLVAGDPQNFKLTTTDDLARAHELFSSRT